jgi:hypothetical protein
MVANGPWQAGPVADVPPLVAEASRKAGLLWISVEGGRPAPAWHVWRDDGTYVVTGPGEQPLPGLADADRCDVTVRSADSGGRIVTWRAAVRRLDPASEEWAEAVPALVAARLNLGDAATTPLRWAETAAVLRLDPTGELVEAGDTLPDGSLAAPPPPSPARSPTRLPWMLGHRRARRSRRG